MHALDAYFNALIRIFNTYHCFLYMYHCQNSDANNIDAIVSSFKRLRKSSCTRVHPEKRRSTPPVLAGYAKNCDAIRSTFGNLGPLSYEMYAPN